MKELNALRAPHPAPTEVIAIDLPSVLTIWHDERLGHLMVEHDGGITWDTLWEIKNEIWGDCARAIEVYPARTQLVNSASVRHLWRLGSADFAPDLLGDDGAGDSLLARMGAAWAEARR